MYGLSGKPKAHIVYLYFFMLPIPLFIIINLNKGEQRICRLTIFNVSFVRSESVFRLYLLVIDLLFGYSSKHSARSFPLWMATLIPSNELALIKPAASPIRKTLSFESLKSYICLGLDNRQDSVFIHSPSEYPTYSQIFSFVAQNYFYNSLL